MSYYSIKKNNDAIENIIKIFPMYEQAKNDIEEKNENAMAIKIVNKIDENIIILKDIKKRIEEINSQIRIERNKINSTGSDSNEDRQ